MVPDVFIALAAVVIALWLRPWRVVRTPGPPWPWVFTWALMPLLWSLDLQGAIQIFLPVLLAPLMVLLCGWPMTILALGPVAALTALMGDMGVAYGLHRMVWMGVMPATMSLIVGWCTRRFLPKHIFVYILARGWFGTFLTCATTAWLMHLQHPLPQFIASQDFIIANILNASGEATLTATLVSAMVVFRPDWLATYADRLYLPDAQSNEDAK